MPRMRSAFQLDLNQGFGSPAEWNEIASTGSVRVRCFSTIRSVLGVRDRAACRERFYRLLHACCAQVEQLREPFGGAIECDETTVGCARKGKRGWGAAGKAILFGLIKRKGRVRAMRIRGHDRVSIMWEIDAHTTEGAL